MAVDDWSWSMRGQRTQSWSLSCRRGGWEWQGRKRELERLRSIGITITGLPLLPPLGASPSGRLFLLLEPGP